MSSLDCLRNISSDLLNLAGSLPVLQRWNNSFSVGLQAQIGLCGLNTAVLFLRLWSSHLETACLILHSTEENHKAAPYRSRSAVPWLDLSYLQSCQGEPPQYSSACPVAHLLLVVTLDGKDLTVFSFPGSTFSCEQVTNDASEIFDWSLQSFMTSFCHRWQWRLLTVCGTRITKCPQRNAWETVCWTRLWKQDSEGANISHGHNTAHQLLLPGDS